MSSGPLKREKNQPYLQKSYHPKLRVVKTSEPIQFFPQQLTDDFFEVNPQKQSKFSSRYFDTPLTSQRKYRIKMLEKKEEISKALNEEKGELRTFSYISQLYKKPIERQIIIKKSKEENNKQFASLLVYKSIKLKPKEKIRSPKKSEKRCRCHHNSQSVDMKLIKEARLTPRPPLVSKFTPSSSPKPKKQFEVIKPQNWMVDSWDQQGSKIDSNSYLL